MNGKYHYVKRTGYVILLFVFVANVQAQTSYIISGKVLESIQNRALPNATIHLKASNYNTFSKADGSFRLVTTGWHDTIEITCIGYDQFTMKLEQGHTSGLSVALRGSPASLQEVVVGIAKKAGRPFMEKVIERKSSNNPARIKSYTYQRYSRNELDISNIDFQKAKGRGIKSLMLNVYAALDSTVRSDKELPIYFAETLANDFHDTNPLVDLENVIAKKNLGFKTDMLLSKLDKFYFHFNIYDDWIPIFDQSYVSPLSSNGFAYYTYFEGDSMVYQGVTTLQIRFSPLRSYEKAFSGTMWINTFTLAVESVDMHLNKTANLNFVQDISYNEEYKQVYDSSSGKTVYMPFKYASEVRFESGSSLLGIPASKNNQPLSLLFRNTTVTSKIALSKIDVTTFSKNSALKEHIVTENLPQTFWNQNRSDSLTDHEKTIYQLADSLKSNRRFQINVKAMAIAGTGYWDFGNKIRTGSYYSLLSHNQLEGWRMRIGFLTMPGISKSSSLFGYGAYGTKDQKLKGQIGIKHIWNEAQWTKTSLSYGQDYDFVSNKEDELDKDNIINSAFRKNIPYSRIYIREALLKHEQYISRSLSANMQVSFKELNPAFHFEYRPINQALDKPYDSVFSNSLPVAEASIGLRYVRKERSRVFNYDKMRLGTFSAVFTASYTQGFEHGKAQFAYQKIQAGVEQFLRLPPKSLLYYRFDAGQVFGTLPYLLLNVPAGNEYYVDSKSIFNTMVPYEFAADRFVSFHSRFYLGGALLDKVPLLQKLGWRERFTLSTYWGDMTKSNTDYNALSGIHSAGKAPFTEVGIGIENIFHLISIEYYRRLNYLDHAYARKEGIFAGFAIVF